MYQLYLLHLHPKNKRLFQKPARYPSKKFNIHDFGRRVLYENSALGEGKIKEMLPKLTEMLKMPRLTNHSIRTQAIQTLIKMGFPEHVILQFTGIYLKNPEKIRE